MSNRKLNPHIHFIETKNALHTWVIIAGWSFDGRAGIDLNLVENTLRDIKTGLCLSGVQIH